MGEHQDRTQFALLTYPGVTALDLIGPYEVLHRLPGVEVRFVWKQPGPICTDSGVLALGATHSLVETCNPDVLLVPGSQASTATVMADRGVIQWIKTVHETTKLTTSVCSGALILGAAGILKGLPATTHWAAMKALNVFGAKPLPSQRVVRSGKVITSAGVSAGIDMAFELVAELFGEQRARVEQLYIEYDPQPPFGAGHMSKADHKTIELARMVAAERVRNPRDVISVPILLARSWAGMLARRRDHRR